jgi:putative tryptophan/tyrosine transport system substrate-binding protein
MNRRAFVTGLGAVLAVPFVVEAQPGKVYRIGYLAQGDPSHPAEQNLLAGFRQGLGELGYVEGHNLVIEYRWAEMNVDRLPVLAAELVQLKVDLIASVATRASLAAKHATRTVPIVMTVSLHAVESGLVESLAHPGANITGMTGLSDETIAKRLGLLKEVVVTLVRVAVLWNPEFYNRAHEPQWRAIEAAAVRLGVTLESVEVRRFDDFDGAFAGMTRSRVGGVIVFPDPLTVKHRQRIAELATQHRLPTAYQDRESVEVGGLLSYGLSFFESARRAAYFVDKILKGAKPAELPVEQPTKFELVINLKTAKALGLTIPRSLLLRADQIIE